MPGHNAFMKFQITVKIYSADKTPLEEIRQEIKSILNLYKAKYNGSVKSGNLVVRQR